MDVRQRAQRLAREPLAPLRVPRRRIEARANRQHRLHYLS
jgi:hypothetical protein